MKNTFRQRFPRPSRQAAHRPQLRPSVFVSMHPPPGQQTWLVPASRSQNCPLCPLVHGATAVEHTPFVHVPPAPQLMPQPPQFAGSFVGFTHTELKPCEQHMPDAPMLVWHVPPNGPLWQVRGTQRPPAQNVSIGQLRPQFVDAAS